MWTDDEVVAAVENAAGPVVASQVLEALLTVTLDRLAEDGRLSRNLSPSSGPFPASTTYEGVRSSSAR